MNIPFLMGALFGWCWMMSSTATNPWPWFLGMMATGGVGLSWEIGRHIKQKVLLKALFEQDERLFNVLTKCTCERNRKERIEKGIYFDWEYQRSPSDSSRHGSGSEIEGPISFATCCDQGRIKEEVSSPQEEKGRESGERAQEKSGQREKEES